jgi:hypothetical protein
MTETIHQSTAIIWATVTGKITRQAMDAFCRDLHLQKRIQHLQNYLMAKAWYAAQVFPPTPTVYGK